MLEKKDDRNTTALCIFLMIILETVVVALAIHEAMVGRLKEFLFLGISLTLVISIAIVALASLLNKLVKK